MQVLSLIKFLLTSPSPVVSHMRIILASGNDSVTTDSPVLRSHGL